MGTRVVLRCGGANRIGLGPGPRLLAEGGGGEQAFVKL